MYISCPSFIIPATRVENVKHLKGVVDEVELLYMCSLSAYDLPDDITELAELGMRYNVHMPYDRDLSKVAEWDCIIKFAEAFIPLGAHTHTFHIQPDAEFFKGLERFKLATGLPVTLENGGIDIASFELSDDDICLDVGHMLMHGQDIIKTIDRYADRIKMFHIHGVNDGKDHQSLRYFPSDIIKYILNFAVDHNLTVSVEVFNEADLSDSLKVISSL